MGTGKQVGRFGNPEEEAVRFCANPALIFPPSEIHSLEFKPPVDSKPRPPELTVNIMGLTGQLGVLPNTYSEWVNDRIRARDHTLQDFFNLFHHRLLSLFYQAWEKYRFPVAYERDRNDRFTGYLLAFLGLGTQGLRNRSTVPDDGMSFYTALLALQTRSATALRQENQFQLFQVPVEIEQFVGVWRPIPPSDQTRTGDEREYFEQVGLGAIAGDEVWDQQSSARIVLGPLTLSQYLDFLPNGSAYRPLCNLIEFFSRREIDFELQLMLKRDETPGVVLQDEAGGFMLGWTTWIKNAPMTRDPADTVLQLQ